MNVAKKKKFPIPIPISISIPSFPPFPFPFLLPFSLLSTHQIKPHPPLQRPPTHPIILPNPLQVIKLFPLLPRDIGAHVPAIRPPEERLVIRVLDILFASLLCFVLRFEGFDVFRVELGEEFGDEVGLDFEEDGPVCEGCWC